MTQFINIKTAAFAVIAGCLILTDCAAQVKRIDPDTAVDLSGRFNDTDAGMIADELIDQMLQAGWHSKFKTAAGRNPVVIVGQVRNMTFEHISIQTFTKQLERAMLNSGKIDLVASREERLEIREERMDQKTAASLNTKKRYGMESGADFMLKGILSSIIDEEKGKKVVFYQCDMNVINIKTNKIIWAGQKKIKKYIVKPLFSI